MGMDDLTAAAGVARGTLYNGTKGQADLISNFAFGFTRLAPRPRNRWFA
jgi:hypothetical protein